MKDSTCVSDCGAGLYKNTLTNICTPCNTACKNCTGPSTSECTECEPLLGFFLWAEQNTCTRKCPSNLFGNSVSGICEPCDNCKTCVSSKSRCTSCENGTYLDPTTETCNDC